MTSNAYDPSTSLAAYYPSRTESRPARLWSTEKLIQDLAEIGMLSVFEGSGTDPTGLDGYAIDKLWLRVDDGITDAPGELRYYDGTGLATSLDNWPELTSDGFKASLALATFPLALASGGTGVALTDPGGDRAMFWDDSVGAVSWLAIGSGLTLTDTTLTIDPAITTELSETTAKVAHRPYVTPFDFDAEPNAAGADNTAALTAAIAAAKAAKVPFRLVGGYYRCTGNIDVPTGTGCPDIEGPGWNTSAILFDGAGVTTGLTYTGDRINYDYAGSIRNVRVDCYGGAKRGISYDGVNHPTLDRVIVANAVDAGVYFDYTLNGAFVRSMTVGCGSATDGQIVVDNSTTWMWLHSRISGSNASTTSGVMIDRTPSPCMIGGTVESSKIAVKIGSKAESVMPVSSALIQGVNFENASTHYIEAGYGWTGTAGLGVLGITIADCVGYLSGSTTTIIGAKFKNTVAAHTRNSVFSCYPGIAETTWQLDGTNYGTTIGGTYQAHGQGFMWLRDGVSQIVAASPLRDWSRYGYDTLTTIATLSGTTPNLLDSVEGGIPKVISFANGSATLVDGFNFYAPTNLEILITATNGNTTLKHLGGGDGQFKNKSGANQLLTAGAYRRYLADGTTWIEL